jgi:PqqD family protein of HPr-rel-A system
MASATYKRRSKIREQSVGKDLIVFDEKANEVHVLNGTAAFIWACLKTPATSADIETALRSEYDMNAVANVPAVIQRLLGDLESKGLIENAALGA